MLRIGHRLGLITLETTTIAASFLLRIGHRLGLITLLLAFLGFHNELRIGHRLGLITLQAHLSDFKATTYVPKAVRIIATAREEIQEFCAFFRETRPSARTACLLST